jgi:hypothetical protein
MKVEKIGNWSPCVFIQVQSECLICEDVVRVLIDQI